jgi:predicted adenylyl cyclase CyaB
MPPVSDLVDRANPVETESKYPVKDIPKLNRLLKQHGFKVETERKFQRDEYFDTPEMFSKRLDYVIRLRKEDGMLAIALKGPRHWVGKTYSRIELEFPAGSENKVREALGRSGFEVTWFFEKRRTTFKGKDESLLVALDEIPELGFFVEIEGTLSKVREMEAVLKEVLGPQEKRNYAEIFRAHKLEGGVRLDRIAGGSFS